MLVRTILLCSALCSLSLLIVACDTQRATGDLDGRFVVGKDLGFEPDRNYRPPPPRPDLGPPDAAKPYSGQPVDVLFVIDDSGSMEDKQARLTKSFPALLAGLRSPRLGSDGSGLPCNAKETAGCLLPNLHIGVVTTDLGAGKYALPSCEITNGKRGKLQDVPRIAGCRTPTDPWIAYDAKGKTSNLKGGAVSAANVAAAFSCIAPVGIQGCGFEMPLEAARRALDPLLNTNPGFLRSNAALAVVFLTDEDDCSARNPQLFDPQQQALTDPLGPLTSFRCFEFGIRCDINDRMTAGARKNCKPAYDWLHKVGDYIEFFRALKPGQPVVMAAITGPSSPVVVGKNGNMVALQPSCQGAGGGAVPALRIDAVVNAFGGHRSSICDGSYGTALSALGQALSPR